MFSLVQTPAEAEAWKRHISNIGKMDIGRYMSFIWYVGCSRCRLAHPLCTTPPPLSSQKLHVYFSTRSYVVPLIVPPLMAVRTFLLKPSRLLRRSSAASLFNGSEALGSKNKNCNFHQVSLIARTRYPTLPLYGRPRAEAHVPVLTCSPTMTAFRFNTGFQSSRRMFKQTLPSRSILGW